MVGVEWTSALFSLYPSATSLRYKMWSKIVQLVSYRADLWTQVCVPLKSMLIITVLHMLFCIAFFAVVVNILQSPLSVTSKTRWPAGVFPGWPYANTPQPFTFKTFSRREGRIMQQHLVFFPQRWGEWQGLGIEVKYSVQEHKTQQCLSNSMNFWLWSQFNREQPTFKNLIQTWIENFWLHHIS